MRSLVILLVVLAVAFACPSQTGFKIHQKRSIQHQGREDKPLNWLEKGLVYQIYPRSFQDSDGDGVGDLKGIISRLDHFVQLGINVIWISPIFKSPMADFGYDVSDFTDIDPIFGTIQDFTDLTAAAKSKGLKLILDMVPNHSSDEHEWFIKSVNRIDPYTDYYVWLDGDAPGVPPTNWLSVFGGPAWTFNEQRGQWYLHQFVAKQPDLNYRNPLVHEEFKNILRFWLDRGTDGFRVDAVPHLYEDPAFPDELPSGNPNADPDQYDYLIHDQITWNRPETYDVMAEFRQVLQEYEDGDGQHRAMMTEAYVPLENVIQFYGNETFRMADFPFNFALINGISNCLYYCNTTTSRGYPYNGTQLRDTIVEFLDAIPSWVGPQGANWVLGNHDQRRLASRYGEALVDGMIMVQMLLPGTPVTYYGEEISMKDQFISYEDTLDPQGCQMGPDRYEKFSRDPARTPMQWDDTFNAGFSTAAETWLPMGENYPTVNVKLQKENLVSHLNIYRTMVALRQEASVLYGAYDFPIVDADAFTLTRIRTNSTSYIVVLNVGLEGRRFNLSGVTGIPEKAKVVVRSVQATSGETQIGFTINTNDFPVGAQEGLVLSFVAL
ncbi:maltase A3 [Daphnia magna]|uniref:maltase A3 n=1 Tax=Daphnia magna TaxID=35525 RepID=UPI001E1BA4C6|nr:maltase A3 [Daphnia magna]